MPARSAAPPMNIKKRGKETKENQKNDNNTKTKEWNQILPIIMRKCKINKCGNIRRDK